MVSKNLTENTKLWEWAVTDGVVGLVGVETVEGVVALLVHILIVQNVMTMAAQKWRERTRVLFILYMCTWKILFARRETKDKLTLSRQPFHFLQFGSITCDSKPYKICKIHEEKGQRFLYTLHPFSFYDYVDSTPGSFKRKRSCKWLNCQHIERFKIMF